MEIGLIWLPVLIAAIGIIANLALDVLTGLGLIGPQFGLPLYLLARIVALSAAVFPGLYALGKAEKRERTRQRRREIADVSRVLEASVRRLFPNENLNHIRANLMIVVGDTLDVLCGWNMDAYPDSKMSLGYGEGVAGKVWVRATENPLSKCWQPVYAPREQLHRRNLGDQWGLDSRDIEKTSHIRWILSTPLLHRNADILKFLGVLNLDGVTADLNSMEVFEDSQFHLKCVAVADLVGNRIVEGDLMTM